MFGMVFAVRGFGGPNADYFCSMMLRFCLFAVLTLAVAASQGQTRDFKFKIEGAVNDTVHLAYYLGNKLYYKDTTYTDASGEGQFSSSKDMPGGVYAVVADRSKYFEVLVNEPEIEIHTTKSDMTGAVEVKKSEENRIFYDYIHFLADQRKLADTKKALIRETSDKLRKFRFEGELKEIDAKVKDYQRDLIEKHKGMFVSQVVNMSMPLEREPIKNEDGSIDSTASYFDYRAHFWDNFDLTDSKIVGTPVFHNKLDEYVSKTIPQIPDTITRLVDELIEGIGPDNQTAFKYVVHFVTHKYETSEVMGMDAVFAHMGATYYCPDESGYSRVDWMTESKLEELCKRVAKLNPLLIGQKAPYLKLTDTTEAKWFSLYDMPNDFVVVIFWDPHCGACKKEMPALREVYMTELKEMGVGVFAVAKAVEEKAFKDWKTFIIEKELDWVNVGLTPHIYSDAKANPRNYVPGLTTLSSLNYSDTWDVYSTPKLFVVDKDRKIVAKQLAADQLADLIKRLKNRDESQ